MTTRTGQYATRSKAGRHCRNLDCHDWFTDRSLLGFCPACRYFGPRMFALGAAAAGILCTVVEFALRVWPWG